MTADSVAFYSTYFASGVSGQGVDTVGVQVFASGDVRVFFCGGASTVEPHTKWMAGSLVGSLENGTADLHELASKTALASIHFANDSVDGVVFRKEDPKSAVPWTAKRIYNATWAGLYENEGFTGSDHKGLIVGVLEGSSPRRYWWQGAAIHATAIEIVDPIGVHELPSQGIDTKLLSAPGVLFTLKPIAIQPVLAAP